jgi:hypothetical protein
LRKAVGGSSGLLDGYDFEHFINYLIAKLFFLSETISSGRVSLHNHLPNRVEATEGADLPGIATSCTYFENASVTAYMFLATS